MDTHAFVVFPVANLQKTSCNSGLWEHVVQRTLVTKEENRKMRHYATLCSKARVKLVSNPIHMSL